MAINRKDFLKTLGGMAALTILPRKVLGGQGHIAPNDQLTKGIIGMGGIGFSANHFSSNEQCRLVAMCDVDSNHLNTGVTRAKKSLIIVGDPKCFVNGIKNDYVDYRKTTLKDFILEKSFICFSTCYLLSFTFPYT